MKKNMSIAIASIFAITTLLMTATIGASTGYANLNYDKPLGYNLDYEVIGSIDLEKPLGYNLDYEVIG